MKSVAHPSVSALKFLQQAVAELHVAGKLWLIGRNMASALENLSGAGRPTQDSAAESRPL